MGVTNIFTKANELLESELHIRVERDTPNLQFQLMLHRVGWERFEHCVHLVKLWMRPYHRGRQRYEKLMQLLREVAPEKVGKYRNPRVEAAVQAETHALSEFLERIRREP